MKVGESFHFLISRDLAKLEYLISPRNSHFLLRCHQVLITYASFQPKKACHFLCHFPVPRNKWRNQGWIDTQINPPLASFQAQALNTFMPYIRKFSSPANLHAGFVSKQSKCHFCHLPLFSFSLLAREGLIKRMVPKTELSLARKIPNFEILLLEPLTQS